MRPVGTVEAAHEINKTHRAKAFYLCPSAKMRNYSFFFFFMLEFSRISELFSSPGESLVPAKISHRGSLPPLPAGFTPRLHPISLAQTCDTGEGTNGETERERERDKRDTETERET